MDNQELILQINKELAMEISQQITAEELQNRLAIYINDLIRHHFEKLVSLLYRIDVSEAKIKLLLQDQTDKNAADIIAALIIERQLQKIKSRRQFSQPNNRDTDAEKW
jgi:hypothetical protein